MAAAVLTFIIACKSASIRGCRKAEAMTEGWGVNGDVDAAAAASAAAAAGDDDADDDDADDDDDDDDADDDDVQGQNLSAVA